MEKKEGLAAALATDEAKKAEVENIHTAWAQVEEEMTGVGATKPTPVKKSCVTQAEWDHFSPKK